MTQLSDAQTDPIAASLAGIRMRFVADLNGRRKELDRLVEAIDDTPEGRERMRQACRIAHRIVGTAGTLGLPALGEIAAEAEDAMLAATAAEEDEMDLDAVRTSARRLARAMTEVAEADG